jgi:hypothetical protein
MSTPKAYNSVGNGVSLFMGRALAKAVVAALEHER